MKMKSRKSSARNIFNTVKMAAVPSNYFDLSHDVKMSFGMGRLIPHFVEECVPGDKWNIQVDTMLRFAPLVAPVMHRVEVTQHFYFVPNRILWSGWEKWIVRENEDAFPYVDVELGGNGALADYLKYIQLETPVHQSAMPIAAYVKVWDEYYRDQNLQDERFVPLVAGDNTTAYEEFLLDAPFRRAWMHDYFTSCLPFAQKGDAVQIPLTVAPEQNVYLDHGTTANGGNQRVKIWDPGTSTWVYTENENRNLHANGGPVPLTSSLHAGTGDGGTYPDQPALLDPNGTFKVDVQSDATDINSLRRAFRLQEWLEKNARGGTRYIENILAHFGVRSSDARLQRPEYLGGTKSRVVISEVLSTAQTYAVDTLYPLGQMAGHGISVDRSGRISFRCEEHGWIIGVVNIQPTTAYQQGIPRSHTRFDPLDFYWPTFANIGEQEVKVKELFASGVPADDEETFGYIPRYSEYKYSPSRVHGEFKSSLAYWHWGRIFDTKPQLTEEFIECNPRDDQFAVTSTEDQQVLSHIYFNVGCSRKMPRFGVPTI